MLAESSRKSRMKAPEPLLTDFDTVSSCLCKGLGGLHFDFLRDSADIAL